MAQNPNGMSQLDPGQITKRVFDPNNDRLRVDAAITAPDGTSILIDATTDSIKIGNTASGPFLNINADGSINAVIEDAGAFTTSTGTTSTVAASVSNGTLLSANTARKSFILYNDSSSAVYVKFGTTASSTDFTLKMIANSTFIGDLPVYLGRIDAIWVRATGNMRITELT